MTKWYRISVILKALESATVQTGHLQGAKEERNNEKFLADCHEMSKTGSQENFIIDINTLTHARIITDYFFKTHLLLTGYNINVHLDLNSIINSLLVS